MKTSTLILGLLILTLAIGSASAALTDNNELYYAFDEGSGITTTDAAGNSNGTLFGTSGFSDGKVGTNALQCNETSGGYLETGTNLSFILSLFGVKILGNS